MANYSAIYSVGNSIEQYLQNAYPLASAFPCQFKLVSSTEIATEEKTALDQVVSIFLHRITMNENFRAANRLQDSPNKQPVVFLDLHYLLTYWGSSAQAEQTILGWTVQQLQTSPILDNSVLTADGAWDPTESVQLVMADLSLEDVLRIWDALGPKYRLSVSYSAGRPYRPRQRSWSAGGGHPNQLPEPGGRGMTPAFSESSDHRVLGGFVFIDAITNSSIPDPLRVTSPQLQLRVNRSGVYAIFDGPGFRSLTMQFIPNSAAWPAAQNFEVTVQDPSLRYLGRRAQVQAPQALNTVFTPQQVTLYPSPSADVAPNWAVVRLSVTGSNGLGLPWTLVRVIKSDNSVAATAMTDARGEGLLAVPGMGIQVSGDASGSVTETTIPVIVQAWFDPSVVDQPADWVPNPDDVLANLSSAALKTGKFAGALGPRQVLFAGITISV